MGWMLSRFVDETLRDLAAANPTLAETIPLEDSPSGKPITAIRLSGPGIQERIPVLVTGGSHAREWAPPDSLVGFVKRLLTAMANGVDIVYPPFTSGGVTYSDPSYRIPAAEVTDIFDRFEIIVLPLINPDGRDVSLLGTTSTNHMWRKNRRDLRNPGENLGPDCIGVDLNRNFPIAWEHTDFYRPDAAKFDDVSTNKCHFQVYKGPSAGSEVETQNVMTLAKDNFVQAFVDVHMTGRLITHPWAFERVQVLHPTWRFDDAGFNHLPAIPQSGRDGQLGDSYGEFIPTDLLDRLKTLGAAMAKEILESAGASPVAKLRSTYRTMPTLESVVVAGLDKSTTFTGGADDYVFSLQFTDDTMPECVAFTVEAGLHPGDRRDNPLEEDGGFFPDFEKQFPKVEREIHAGLFGLVRAL